MTGRDTNGEGDFAHDFKRTTLEETLAVSPLLVLDGAMSTPLENMGIDLNTKLWTAKVLADQPEMVKQVHKNYFKAGADCGITCSYQATVPGTNGHWIYKRTGRRTDRQKC